MQNEEVIALAQIAKRQIDLRDAEIARLKAEVERLKGDSYSKEWADLRFAAARNDALEEAATAMDVRLQDWQAAVIRARKGKP